MNRWLTKRAIAAHVTLLVLLPAFVLLGRWQLHRALSGNGLSWAYTVEWPIFALYAIVLWWRIVHDQDGDKKVRLSPMHTKRSSKRALADAKADAELATYNAYLATLHGPTGSLEETTPPRPD